MATEQAPVDAAARARAVDPRRSVLVQAPAGSGKTTLLVTRFLRLLAHVERPEEILAITFTRKAAAEMRGRVLAALRDRDDPLAAAVREHGRSRGWSLDEQPGRLRIQTIDSFASTLTAAAPLLAGLAFGTLEEDAERHYDAAVARLFAQLDEAPFSSELATFLELYDNDFSKARASLVAMLARRDQWLDAVHHSLAGHKSDDRGFADRLQAAIVALHDDVIARLEQKLGAHADDVLEVARYSADGLDAAERGASRRIAWRHAARLFLTGSGAWRRRYDRSVGFPSDAPDAADRRAQARAAAESLTAADAGPLLRRLTQLPAVTVADDERAALHPVGLTLALAALALDETFAEADAADFIALTFAARRVLGERDRPTDVALVLDHRISHVLVDEFQDTSSAQLDLLERLIAGWTADDGRTLFAVGDPMQSIYRFRAADVALFLRAAESGIENRPLEFVRLEANFRATPALVDWCNAVFPGAFGAATDAVTGAMPYAAAHAHDSSTFGETPAIALFPPGSPAGEAAYVAAHLAAQRAREPESSLAVLVRSRAHASAIVHALDERGLPWHGEEMEPLADVPVVRDLLTLLRVGCDPDDPAAALSLLRAPLIGLDLCDLLVVAEAGGAAAVQRTHALRDRLTAGGAERLERAAALLRDFLARRGQQPTRTWLESVWLRLGGADAYDDPDAIAHAGRFLDLVERTTPHRAEVEPVARATARLHASRPAARDAIHVMTIHKSKGLEFDHVVVPALDRTVGTDAKPPLLWDRSADRFLVGTIAASGAGSIYAWLERQEQERAANERVRLLYVAATRARRSLLLTATTRDDQDPDWSPPSGSLLAPIWACARACGMRPAVAADVGSPPSPHAETRLPASYRWVAPVQIAATGAFAVPAPRTPPTATGPAVAIGVVVHRWLRHLAERAPELPSSDWIDAHVDDFAAELANEGVAPGDVRVCTHEVARQLQSTLADPLGRRLLSRPGENEAGFTAPLDGAPRNGGFERIVVDRCFRDEAGVLWVIDYKTGRAPPGEPVDVYVANEARDHAAQLRRYASILARLEPGRIRAAIYFTAHARVVDIDVS